MPIGSWIKVKPQADVYGSSWKKITNLFVKKSTTSWTSVADAWVKVSPTTWKPFYTAGTAPNTPIEILTSFDTSDRLRLQGKNYTWSPTPTNLKYKFILKLENNTTYDITAYTNTNNPTTSTILPTSTTYVTIANGATDPYWYPGQVNTYIFQVVGTTATSQDFTFNAEYAFRIPKAPTITTSNGTPTSVDLTITAATTDDYLATNRYIVYANDGTTTYTAASPGALTGLGGYSVLTNPRIVSIGGLDSTKTYTFYVRPSTGYSGSTESNVTGYQGNQGSVTFTPPAKPTIISGQSPTWTLISGTAGTVGATYRLSSGGWNGSPTKYRYEIGYNNQAGTIITTLPSTTTYTTAAYVDYTFNTVTPTYPPLNTQPTVYGAVIANNTYDSDKVFATTNIGPFNNTFTPGTISISGGSGSIGGNYYVTTGATLTLSTSGWPTGTSFTYQWKKSRDINGLGPVNQGTATTQAVSTIGEYYWCVVSYTNSNYGTNGTGSTTSIAYTVVPAAPAYTLSNLGNGSFRISSVTSTGGSDYYGSYVIGTSNAVAIASASSPTANTTNTDIASGSGSVTTTLYSSAYVSALFTRYSSWESTSKSVTVTTPAPTTTTTTTTAAPITYYYAYSICDFQLGTYVTSPTCSTTTTLPAGYTANTLKSTSSTRTTTLEYYGTSSCANSLAQVQNGTCATTTAAPTTTTTTTTTTTAGGTTNRLCTSADVRNTSCATTGCDNGGCGSGAICTGLSSNRCFTGV